MSSKKPPQTKTQSEQISKGQETTVYAMLLRHMSPGEKSRTWWEMDRCDLVMESQVYHVHRNSILRNSDMRKKGAKCVPVLLSRGEGKAYVEALF